MSSSILSTVASNWILPLFCGLADGLVSLSCSCSLVSSVSFSVGVLGLYGVACCILWPGVYGLSPQWNPCHTSICESLYAMNHCKHLTLCCCTMTGTQLGSSGQMQSVCHAALRPLQVPIVHLLWACHASPSTRDMCHQGYCIRVVGSFPGSLFANCGMNWLMYHVQNH